MKANTWLGVFRRRRAAQACAAEALQDANPLTREIIATAAEGLVVYDTALRYRTWNRFMENLTGVPAADVLGHKAVALFPHLSEQGVDRLLQRALAGETVHTSDIPYRVPKQDKSGWVSGTYSPHRDAQGRIVGVVGFIHDITDRKRAEESLRESEIRFRTLVACIPQKIYIKDRDFRYVSVNESFARDFGRPVEAILGQDDYALLTKEDADRLRAGDRRVMDTGLTEEATEPYVRHGHTIWVYSIKMPVRDDQGRVTGVFGIFWDVTTRKQTEDREQLARNILERLNRLEGATDTVHDILQMIKSGSDIDAVGIRLREGDDFPYYQTVGFAPDFVRAENHLCARNAVGEIVRDDAGNPVLECMCGNILRCRTNPQLPYFTEGGSFWSNRTTDIQAATSAKDRPLYARNHCHAAGYESVALIPLRSGKEIIGLLQLNDRRRDQFTPGIIRFFEGLGASIGIALFRQHEEELLRESEARFHKIFDEGPLGTVLVNYSTGRFVKVNAAFCQMLGYTEQELERLTFVDVTHPEHRSQDVAAIKRLWDGIIPQYKTEKRYLKKNGESVWGSLTATLVRDEKEKPLYMLSMIENISERKRAEAEQAKLQGQLAQAQKMESVGRLAGGVAHDFNNLLMGIMGYAQLCREKIEPGHPICEWLDDITAGAKRSANLTSQLLAFARKQTIAPKVMDLNAAISGTVALLRRLIGEDIAINWRPGAAIGPVKLDPSQLDQVLTNLAVNARDAINGTGVITIETENATLDEVYCAEHPGASPGNYVLLTFRDTGCGMDRETLVHIFEPFFTTKGVGQGTGLGLATVYGIAKQNGGFIDVSSEPGQGTVFKIYWARFTSQPAPLVAGETHPVAFHGHETILLVEDDESVRDITHLFLTDLGYTILEAEDPEKALRLATQYPGEIHLLLTDVIMPGMNGKDLAQRLSELRPSIKRLFISGFTADVLAQRGILQDNLNFLAKPFTRDDLAGKLRECLGGRPETATK